MAKRLFSFLLVLVMVLSVAPVQVFAAEETAAPVQEVYEEQIPDEETIAEETEVVEETEEEIVYEEEELTYEEMLEELNVDASAVEQAQEDLIALLESYLGSADISEEEMQAVVDEMDWETYQTARWEISELEAAESIEQLSEEEFALLERESELFFAFSDALEAKAAADDTVSMLATTVTVLDGQISVTDSLGNGTVSGNTVTVKAAGSLFSKKTNTVTIANESENVASLSFAYAASGYSSFTVAGEAATSGSYSAILNPGASVTLVLQSKSGLSAGTATLTLSEFALVAAAEASNVTVEFDSAYGSVTVDGTVVEAGSVQEISLTDGATLTAAAANGGRFLGWINAANGMVLSGDASFTLTPAEDMTVKAAFVGENSAPWFLLGSTTQKSTGTGFLGLSKLYYYTVSGGYLFEGLTAATAAAASSSSKALVLMNDATLSAGDYTIPAGVTLLIPFDDANTLYTTQVAGVEQTTSNPYTVPTAYRTLTMAEGANLTVNGTVSLSCKHYYAQGAKAFGAAPCGAVSFIRMEDGSNITVNNGGTLYAYGFITGSGAVTANSGAVVYELFQIADFRGGTQSTDMENGVFPLCQYYVQNIEVPLTLYSGAKEYSYTTIYMSKADFGSSVAFIGSSNAMFNLTSGYVVKRYDGTTDRLMVESHGEMTIDPITLDVGGTDINSGKYELPINSNLTVDICSGTVKINQDVALLPGSVINIGEGTNCILGTNINVYIYDADQWGGYAGAVNKTFVPVIYAPGRVYDRTDADLVDAKIVVDGVIDASQGYAYSTAGGAEVVSNGNGVAKIRPGTQTVTYQMIQAGDTSQSTYVEIPLVPVQMKNADGTYVSSGTTTKSVFTYADGAWDRECAHEYDDGVITTQPGCTTEGVKTYTCKEAVCGDSYTEIIEAVGHSYSSEVTEPTCMDEGFTTHTCTVCGDSYTDTPVAATGHSYSAVVTDPTCVEEGYTTYTCTGCGHSYEADQTEATGHDYETAVTAPTCTDAGYTTYTCKTCGYSEDNDIVAATGHDYDEAVTAPTCTEAGYTTFTCKTCGHTEDGDEVAATGHDYDEVVTAPDCTAGGYTTYTCKTCGHTEKGDEVEAKGHTEVIDAAVEATCTETGLTEGKHCSVCDAVLIAQEIVAAKGHTEVIDAAVEATCTETGLTEGKHCSVCDAVLTAQEIVAAKG
ncbi:MAG: hypothetical protein J6J43_08880, partial [Oscillospiraceae bacterium]|nr:hypothetical protein [Oscillospiraceae bacterium]